jgi:hypothetical protein
MGISPLPRKVTFGQYVGEVIDEVRCERDFEDSDCMFLIQQIRWQDGSESIRFAYYTRPHGGDESQWNYANRPPNMESEVLEELINEARARPWFRTILE